jgi:hypothetical protein
MIVKVTPEMMETLIAEGTSSAKHEIDLWETIMNNIETKACQLLLREPKFCLARMFRVHFHVEKWTERNDHDNKKSTRNLSYVFNFYFYLLF